MSCNVFEPNFFRPGGPFPGFGPSARSFGTQDLGEPIPAGKKFAFDPALFFQKPAGLKNVYDFEKNVFRMTGAEGRQTKNEFGALHHPETKPTPEGETPRPPRLGARARPAVLEASPK